MSVRQFTNSPVEQGITEEVAYTVDTTKWPGTGDPTEFAVVLTDEAGIDVSAAKLSGAASQAAGVITTPKVVGLAEGDIYRVEVRWTKGGNKWRAYGYLKGVG